LRFLTAEIHHLLPFMEQDGGYHVLRDPDGEEIIGVRLLRKQSPFKLVTGEAHGLPGDYDWADAVSTLRGIIGHDLLPSSVERIEQWASAAAAGGAAQMAATCDALAQRFKQLGAAGTGAAAKPASTSWRFTTRLRCMEQLRCRVGLTAPGGKLLATVLFRGEGITGCQRCDSRAHTEHNCRLRSAAMPLARVSVATARRTPAETPAGGQGPPADTNAATPAPAGAVWHEVGAKKAVRPAVARRVAQQSHQPQRRHAPQARRDAVPRKLQPLQSVGERRADALSNAYDQQVRHTQRQQLGPQQKSQQRPKQGPSQQQQQKQRAAPSQQQQEQQQQRQLLLSAAGEQQQQVGAKRVREPAWTNASPQAAQARATTDALAVGDDDLWPKPLKAAAAAGAAKRARPPSWDAQHAPSQMETDPPEACAANMGLAHAVSAAAVSQIAPGQSAGDVGGDADAAELPDMDL